MKQDLYLRAGADPDSSGKALVMIHGRGGSASDILQLANHLPVEEFSLIAPQAPGNTWYPYSFMAPVAQNQPSLDQSLQMLDHVRKDLNSRGITDENMYWLGFSQGACLTLEYLTRNATRYGGVIAFTGGLIGATPDENNYNGNFKRTPMLIASSDPDPHVPVERVQESATIINKMEADLLTRIYHNMGHTITRDEIQLAISHVFKKVKSAL
ncbi:MAG: dienelactone hydrolase family protein [Chitinophagaceae bacterium]